MIPVVKVADAQDLSDIVADAVRRHGNTDAIRDLIDQRVAKLLTDSVDEALRSYGDISNQIKKAVSGALALKDPLELPQYNHMVLTTLQGLIDNRLSELLTGRLAEQMEEILAIGAREVKLTEVIKAMTDEILREDRYGRELTCIIEEASVVPGYYRIYMDLESIPASRKYECGLQFGITEKGRIFSLQIERTDIDKAIIVKIFRRWEKMVFAAYVTGATFIIDDFDPDLSLGED